jgi:hypothetical protein
MTEALPMLPARLGETERERGEEPPETQDRREALRKKFRKSTMTGVRGRDHFCRVVYRQQKSNENLCSTSDSPVGHANPNIGKIFQHIRRINPAH